MNQSHEQLENDLKAIIQSGPISELTFYQVNPNFFEFADEGYWIIDGGLEINFPAGVVSAAFSPDLESYVIENRPFSEIYTHNNQIALHNENIAEIEKCCGLNVINAEFKSLEFEYIVDYTMRTEKEQRFVQLILELQNKSKIQIAFVDYNLEENRGPKNFSFSLMNEVLISTKKIIEI